MSDNESDYTEWWKCDSCVGQWYVPEDYDQRHECPLCGHDETTLVDQNDTTAPIENATVSGSGDSKDVEGEYVSKSVDIPDSSNTGRTVRKVIGSVDMPRRDRAREVVAEYEDGTQRREIEVAVNGRYKRQFVEDDH